MKVSIRPDHCIALRLIAAQEHYRKSQDWLNMVPEWERLVEVASQSQAIIKMQAAEIEKLRAALVAAMVREHQAYLICEDIVSSYDWAEDLEYTDMSGLMENMRHTVKGARDRAINDAQYELLNEHYVKNAGTGRWWEKIDLRSAAAALEEAGND